MSNAKNRELMLSRIRKAIATPTEKPVEKPDFQKEIYFRAEEDPAIIFAEQLKKSKAEFYFCTSEDELHGIVLNIVTNKRFKDIRVWEQRAQELMKDCGIKYIDHDKDLENADASVTLCEAIAARTGSIFVSSAQTAGRRLTIYPPAHIVLAYTSQILPDIEDALMLVKARYVNGFPSMVSMISGPSRTADIEKTLVLGAHGPKELIVILIDDSSIDS